MKIRNVAVIAHVDHGKTTLVDAILNQSGMLRSNKQISERVMDSGDLERERGITILAKCTAILSNNIKINLVDTPGHADFVGEVERILSMVDGALLLVDAAEGVMPQTKFVVNKALQLNLNPIVIINKIDRPDARTNEVIDEIFDLFVTMNATEKQLDFPIIYASGKEGWAVNKLSDEKNNVEPLISTIINHVPEPKVDINKPFSMLASILEYDSFLGRIITGKISTGILKSNQSAKVLDLNENIKEETRLTKILSFNALDRISISEAVAGDIVAIAGLQNATVSDTICDPIISKSIDAPAIDPPTLSMTVSVNNSPLAGRDGTKVTSRVLRERLYKESEGNVAIHVKDTDQKDTFEVSGRGELQLGVLIETMRREGYELAISKPKVIFKYDEATEKKLEPIEEVIIDVDENYTGAVVEKMGMRKGELQDMKPSTGGKQRIVFHAPSRGMIGYHGEFLTDTSGTGVMSRVFLKFAEYKGKLETRKNGVLISIDNGKAVAYSLWNLEERGHIFISPGTDVYSGMIIGEHNRNNDLEVNPLKNKQLTNIRASGKDEAIKLTTPRTLSLEDAISYIEIDELVEVTPSAIRLRKKLLLQHERKKAARVS